MTPSRILIVDDELGMLDNLDRLLTLDGYLCRTLANPAAFDETFEEVRPDVLILDLRMPGTDGMTLMGRAHERDPSLPVILITGHATVQSAVEAIKEGAFDYLAKPFTADQLSVAVERALRYRGLVIENQALREQVVGGLDGIVAASDSMASALEQIRRVAPTDASILITGESGTGKELIARAIHRLSARKNGPFIPVDCAALPEGLLESELYGHEKGAFTGAIARKKGLIAEADGGTLFLDEIGEMSTPLQAKLLRVLEERQLRSVGSSKYTDIDVRLVAATNVDLADAVRSGTFREDLFYRINVLHVRLPPLRERPEDIVLLTDHFLNLYSRSGAEQPHLDPTTRRLLEAYSWPGNVRQLRNVVERAVALDIDGVINPEDLPDEITGAGSGHDMHRDSSDAWIHGLPYADARERALLTFRTRYVAGLLRAHDRNVTRAAKVAGVSRRTLHRWIAEISESDSGALARNERDRDEP